ncbi:MAG: hypothetical protein A2Z17_00435 [Gammaproteobacteria bacterium RBG_16_66_13]|nr:MAG: hypothetical protein A2Z17_00435 [Gammaproteobacteria bacterium RBG_16_66_13]
MTDVAAGAPGAPVSAVSPRQTGARGPNGVQRGGVSPAARAKATLRDWAPTLALGAILAAAAVLRFTGLNWDENNHLHPDERFLTMVESGIRLPASLGEYFDTSRSPLNPHNAGYGFFVYGTLPIFLVRYLAEWLGQTGYDQVHLVGRAVSGIFDVLGLVLLFAIGRRLHGRWVGLLAALIGAFTVLLIQHSHFFVVDPVANVFVLAGIYVALRAQEDGRLEWFGLFGLFLGMAMASKINTVALAMVIALAAGARALSAERDRRNEELLRGLGGVVLAAAIAFLAFRVAQPYAFEGPGFLGLRPNPKWLSNLQEIRNQSGGSVDAPFALQWAYRPRFFFSWQNMVLWGMGLPLGLTAWAGVLWAAVEMLRGRWRRHLIIVVWTLVYFLWQAAAFNPTLRYQLPVYPTLILLAAWAAIEGWHRIGALRERLRAPARLGYGVVGGLALVAHLAYGIGFTGIYARPVTRVAASRWIYSHVPGPVNLAITASDGQGLLEPIPLPGDFVLQAAQPHLASLIPTEGGEATGIRLPFVRDLGSGGVDTLLKAEILLAPEDAAPAAVATWSGQLPDTAGSLPLLFESPYPLDPGRAYVLRLSLSGREAIALDGSLVLLASTPQGEAETSMPLPQEDFTLQAGRPFLATFISSTGGEARTLHLPFARSFGRALGTQLVASLLDHPDATEPLAVATWSGGLGEGEQAIEAELDRPARVEAGTTYWLRLELTSGVGLALRGSRIISETSWDDGLPLRLDNKDGFGGLYVGLNQEVYWPDEQDSDSNGVSDKLERFVDTLARGDYLVITSNRQYGSVPRVPIRYPLSTAYYRALFDCPEPQYIPGCGANLQPSGQVNALGYELVGVYQSDPQLGPVAINDQPAEEAFTVYDHPKVLIFARSESFSAEAVRNLLAKVDLSHIVHVLPAQAGSTPPTLMLPPERLAEQRQGGTWSELFPRTSWLNRSEPLAVVVWWVFLGLLGALVFPLVRLAFPGFGSGSYALARALGLLVLAWGVWFLGSLRVPFERPVIVGVLLVLAIAAGLLLWRQRPDWRALWREYRTEILWIEGLALALFLLDLGIRYGNPDLWHPAKGGEKPMDFSYFNAVLRSTSFPPYDPWFAGGYINYYYFGFVLVAVPVKLLGLNPSVAYNLILPSLFSMLGLAGYGVASEVAGRARKVLEPWRLSPRAAGLAAAAALVILGNLGTVSMVYDGLKRIGTPSGEATSEMLAGIPQALRGLGKFVTLQESLPYRMDEWYWNPSRAIPVVPGDVGPITEFPFFTFLYADLHAHMIALPLTVLAVGWAASWLLAAEEKKRIRTVGWAVGLFAGGLILGALRPTNTWDFPVYLAIGVAAAILAGPVRRGARAPGAYLESFLAAAALLALFFLLYQPYGRWYGQGYSAADLWTGSRTTIRSYLVVHGLFLFVVTAWMVWETRSWMAETPLSRLAALRPYIGLIVLSALSVFGATLWAFAEGTRIAIVALPLAAWAIVLILRPGMPWAKRLVLGFVVSALALTLVVELVVLRGDIGRMNTVFKFYLQVWTLFCLASAAAFYWTLENLASWSYRLRAAWIWVLALLVVGAMLFPFTATSSKIRDRMAPDAPHGLDGMAFMPYSEYFDLGGELDLASDYRMIRWLQDNVAGSPVIVEAHAEQYRWGARMTIYTGLPSVLGWSWHQQQQRAVEGDPVTGRAAEIADFFIRYTEDEALEFLERYDVAYIVVGSMERIYYTTMEPCRPGPEPGRVDCDMSGRPLVTKPPLVGPEECVPIDAASGEERLRCPTHGLEKFDGMLARGWLRGAYRDGDNVIYEVLR